LPEANSTRFKKFAQFLALVGEHHRSHNEQSALGIPASFIDVTIEFSFSGSAIVPVEILKGESR